MNYIDTISIFFFVIAFIFFTLSSIKARVIDEYDAYPNGLKKMNRPWGLKISEMKKVALNSKNEKLIKGINQSIIFRKIGYLLLLLIVFYLFIINPLFMKFF